MNCITKTRIKITSIKPCLPNNSFFHVSTTTNNGGEAMYTVYFIILNIRYVKIHNNYATQMPCGLILSISINIIELIHPMLLE